MAPHALAEATNASPNILRRQYYYGSSYYSSPWLSYGRFIVLGGVILLALFFFCIFCCLRSRRRARAGQKPMYGSGWMVPHSQYANAPGQQSGSYPMQSYPPSGNVGATGGYQQPAYQAQPNLYGNRETANEPSYAPPSYPPPSVGNPVQKY